MTKIEISTVLFLLSRKDRTSVGVRVRGCTTVKDMTLACGFTAGFIVALQR